MFILVLLIGQCDPLIGHCTFDGRIKAIHSQTDEYMRFTMEPDSGSWSWPSYSHIPRLVTRLGKEISIKDLKVGMHIELLEHGGVYIERIDVIEDDIDIFIEDFVKKTGGTESKVLTSEEFKLLQNLNSSKYSVREDAYKKLKDHKRAIIWGMMSKNSETRLRCERLYATSR
jgi:hypothetical protein